MTHRNILVRKIRRNSHRDRDLLFFIGLKFKNRFFVKDQRRSGRDIIFIPLLIIFENASRKIIDASHATLINQVIRKSLPRLRGKRNLRRRQKILLCLGERKAYEKKKKNEDRTKKFHRKNKILSNVTKLRKKRRGGWGLVHG